MKNIEIKTTQNVVLQYELADLRDRVLAFLIDFSTLIFGIGLMINFIENVFTGMTQEVLIFGMICIFIFYSLALEVLNNGQSLGKMALRIQVIKITNGRATFADYAGRWVFRLVDIYFSFGGIASVMIASSPKGQRIGDIVANTAVVRLTPKMNLTLNDILTIHTRETYRPEYAQARQLMEEDVLLIKNTLDRYRKYANPSHHQALELLAREIRGVLQIEETPEDNQRFLEIVLRDYVMLTR
jgi:uncharacterized RDD family membrane protein YckC